jgi:hypothetical protein
MRGLRFHYFHSPQKKETRGKSKERKGGGRARRIRNRIKERNKPLPSLMANFVYLDVLV